MRINLTTPMSDDKERQRHNKAVLDAIEQYTEIQMTNEIKFGAGGGGGTGLQSVISLCPHCGGRQTGGGGGVGTRFDDSNGRRMQSDGSSAQLAIGPDGNVVGMKVQAR